MIIILILIPVNNLRRTRTAQDKGDERLETKSIYADPILLRLDTVAAYRA